MRRDQDDSRRFARRPRTRGARAPEIFPTQAEIFNRAYQLFVASGVHPDRVSDCWHRAEDELLDEAARRVLR
ncbi:MAG TPA: hypothetical protein VKD69_03820 [Vicinamibacterales bacterium]|nr:hypothetical protein [Vicinamibacterales bacterium]